MIQAVNRTTGALFDPAPKGLAVVDGPLSPPPNGAALAVMFGRPVDVVLFASTHAPLIAHHSGMLSVNPGSPTLAASGSGTVAVLDVAGRVASVELIRV